jgi:hypothetical protein
MEKTFTIAGTAVRQGVLTLRVANGNIEQRRKILVDGGMTDVLLHALPNPMSREEAVAWLRTQGATVPSEQPRATVTPVVRLGRVTPAQRPARTPVIAASDDEERVIMHEELGFAAAKMSRNFWNSKPLMVRQEWSRNAAWAAGIECPRGTYPELEAWLEMDGVHVREDGRLEERTAA